MWSEFSGVAPEYDQLRTDLTENHYFYQRLSNTDTVDDLISLYHRGAETLFDFRPHPVQVDSEAMQKRSHFDPGGSLCRASDYAEEKMASYDLESEEYDAFAGVSSIKYGRKKESNPVLKCASDNFRQPWR
jgi:hypothetical protein